MDNKAWLWRKKSAEKTTVSSSGVNSPLEGFEEQVGAFQNGGAELEKGFKDLNGKLSSALSNSDDKDDLAKKHEKMAQDTLAARDMAESELMSLRKKSDECLKQRAADEERLTHLDLALRESTQHLQFLREEQEHRIHDAVIKVSKEFEKSRFVLEERLEETTKRLAKIVLENNHLSKSLLSKERLIEDLSKQRSQVESELSALMNKLDSMERENASLKYEVRVLEKELDIRNEEREFNRRSAEISQKQHSERAKKVAKLESECQRLRLLVRKRLPGPVALTKMRNEAEALTRDPSVMRIGALTDQLNAMEEENRALREALERKSNELQVSRNMYFQAASKSSQRNINKLHHEPSIASVSDIGSDDKASRAESWTSALISELENFRNEKLKELPISATTGASEIDLMDDFVEMEKIAVSSANQPFKERLSNFSGQTNSVPSPLSLKGDMEEGMNRLDSLIRELPDWLQDIVKLVVKQNRVNRRDPKEILEDIKTVLESEHKNHRYPGNLGDSREMMNRAISKIVELLEGITLPSAQQNYNSVGNLPKKDGNFSSSKTSGTPTSYTVRVFQWKTSELEDILQKFLHTCYELLSEKTDFCKFGQELALALEWILNHCFSLQDVSSMKEEIVKSFQWDDPRSDSEAEVGSIGRTYDSNKLVTPLAERGVSKNKEPKEDDMMNKELSQTVESLRSEMGSRKESKRLIEDQIKSHRSIDEDLDRQISAARAELNEARERSSSLEGELENKNSCCEELENTCLDLQLQLERARTLKMSAVE
ncbi:filament-like plant protein 7 isoform X2 [Punica granatum]|uniref:Filament-like plant protein 7 isoform X2 n=1 Tax=Punica granatum TaxID=22663 RepID=A0A6P8CXR9_PUNGR|nr:filament-like plant protein 7 isoform X2 [Punica granatum]